MPVAFVIVSKKVKGKINFVQLQEIARSIIAQGLDSKSRLLDETHISTSIIEGDRDFMLADVEINVFCQRYWRRYFSRDKRSNFIAKQLSQKLDCDVACWINMQTVGYSRYEISSEKSYYSIKEDDKVILKKRKNGD